MDKRIAPGGKPKQTKEEKLKKVEEYNKIIEQLKSQRNASTNEDEKKELQRQIIIKQTQRNKTKRSIEYFYPETTLNLTKMIKRKKEQDFNEFKTEVAEKINYLISIGATQKAKVMQEQLYFAELHYKYSIV